MKIFIASTNEKLSKMLLKNYSGTLSFSRLQKLFRQKDIKVNGKRIKSDIFVDIGDKIEVYFDGEAPQINTEIIFEDINVLVAVKPKGVTSENFFLSLKTRYESLFFCHRLDRNTDGVMIFAKNDVAYDEIFNAFKQKHFEKYYIAEVFGKVLSNEGVLTHYLVKDEKNGIVKTLLQPDKDAKKAVLYYKVVERKENSTLLEVKLETGRMHQIRAQLSSIGHFIIGDGKYGNNKINALFENKGMRLTSKKLVLHFDKHQNLHYLEGKVLQI